MQTVEPEIARRPAEPVAVGGRWLLLARIGWMVAALTLVGLFVVAVAARYEQIVTFSNLPTDAGPAALRAGLERSGLSIGFYAAWRVGMEVFFAVVCVALGAVIFWRRSDRRMALFVSFLLVWLGTTFWNTISALSLYHPVWERVGLGLADLRAAAVFLLFYVFPDGRFVPRWTRWLALVIIVGAVSDILFPKFLFVVSDLPVPLFILFMLFWLLTGVYAQVYRYRRVSGPVERQQIWWVVSGFTAAIAGLLGVIFFGEVLFPRPPGTPAELAGSTIITLFTLLIPLSIGVAILRYRLFEIDVLINRALVYGALTAIVAGLYVLVVGGLGTLLQVRGNLLISLLGAGLVAVSFAPLRNKLQRGVNRLMYGERDDPYAVISRLGQRLEATLTPDAALPAIVEIIAAALKLPYVAIALKQKDGFRTVAEHGTSPEEPFTVPLTYQRETVGRLELAPRSPDETFSASDRRLLEDLARQAGVVAHAVRLTADLQRSRERLVTTREEERRRLRRDLHDGVGPQLAALTLRLETARNRLAHDPETRDLLADLSQRARSAVADIRRSVYALRPPALDELGLVPALRETAAQYGQGSLSVAVEAPGELPTLPAAAEVATYRIAQEAITNVVRHADARYCAVRISLDEEAEVMRLEVVDDGRGIEESSGAGVGLSSMRERAEELGGTFSVETLRGGGTRVVAQLPCPSEDTRSPEE